jgi:predicted O-methyltransferase YrrM
LDSGPDRDGVVRAVNLDELSNIRFPAALGAIEHDAKAIGFSLACEPRTGALLRTLAASKPGGRFLELGTGTGISTAWILDGMDSTSTLMTVDSSAHFVEIARLHLGHDAHVTFHVDDGAAFLAKLRGSAFDLIFADTWPGKFDHLEDALNLLRPGGLYVIDDLLPQPTWPQGHAPKVPNLITELARNPRLVLCELAWSSGIIVAAKRA